MIEFLIVIGILVFAVGSSLLFLTSVLRGSNQSNVTAEVKQNGQAVLDSLDSQIRNGTDAVSAILGGTSSAARVTLSDGRYLYLGCIGAGSGTNGWIGTKTALTTDPVPTSATLISVTNTDAVSGVNITNCTFTVQPASTGAISPAVVMVAFVANQGISAPVRSDYNASAAFQTTISLRKY
ncbi:MAG TPA: hypothetical protein VLE91_03845 [Candidatus Saccharimonadales bacterium]|nr:hypothetical protein [Candidatus Saccharimonadales bacterium]